MGVFKEDTMETKEAIKLLQKDLDNPGSVDILDLNKAQKLGIKALKRCKAYKEAHIGLHYTPMPGETEEPDDYHQNTKEEGTNKGNK